jgi:transposase-like protein
LIYIHCGNHRYQIVRIFGTQDAFKDLLGGTTKEMMEAEMDDHLGYQKSE